MMNGTNKMDKFIRLSSMQSGNFNAINNMITFNLPSDGSYDFSSSYVEIQTQVTQATQTAAGAAGTSDVIYCPQLLWYNGESCVNNSMFIRRGQLRSNKQGLVEDILRQDVLQSNLVNYTHSQEEMSSLSYKNAVQHRDYAGQRSSMWRELNQTGSEMSRLVSAPITIPLSQIINLGSARVVPLDRMGGGQLMIDGNFTTGATGWGVESTIHSGGATTQNAEDVTATGTESYGTDVPIQLKRLYTTDWEHFPFWIGCNVVVAVTGGSGGLTAGAVNAVVTEIDYDDTSGVVTLTTDQSLADLTGVQTLTGVTVTLKAPAEEGEIQFTSAALVLKKLAVSPPAEPVLTYTTWETEEFSQSSSSQLNATFRLPANCINALIMLPSSTGDGISRLTALETYRLSIDNVPIINRAVDVTGGIRNCLHYNLIQRSFEAGQLRLRNMLEIQRKNVTTLASQVRGQASTGREEDIIIIGCPTAETAQSKLLQVNLTASAGLVNLTVFKQVVRQVQL